MENDIPNNKGAYVGQKKITGMLVQVTKEIIATAMPKDSGHCMVSDAVMVAAKKKGWRIRKVLTDLQTVRFTESKTGTRYVCFTPRVAQLALLAFDQGTQPEPIEFRLIPVQVIPKRVLGTPAKKRVAVRVAKDTGHIRRPIIHGGPPLATTTIGLRREFGLRQMGVYKAPETAVTAA